jgi:hypothetical protein
VVWLLHLHALHRSTSVPTHPDENQGEEARTQMARDLPYQVKRRGRSTLSSFSRRRWQPNWRQAAYAGRLGQVCPQGCQVLGIGFWARGHFCLKTRG